MRDTVQIHVTSDLPVRTRTLPYANRVEVRFGKAFPVVLLVDYDALIGLGEALREGRNELDAAAAQKQEG
ncbi:hypothetical protein FNH05_18200 [Amycolatopsis rhizosphaerae]|uniref:Uncharacterized protein n=1 Tax=Amycolatopsis rhizosphaerae TaxID=2053003 RepID=A0A558CH54_9PSEU|nr:hypothetical protein [Amycolatopsis rhizosphaerae]TVT48103.1 hypothetical protein FNH05_18200 [Amycolatopsis rhizosphaerae]